MNHIFLDLLKNNLNHAEVFNSQFDHLQESQQPDAVTICCSDSRVLQDHIWGNNEPGQLFSCGNIGNRVMQQTDSGEVVSGDILYPIVHTGTKTAIVMGHTGCGAVTATYDSLQKELSEPAGINHCLDLLKPHLQPALELLPDSINRAGTVNRLVEYNVDRQIDILRQSTDVPDDVDCLGVVYDFQDVYSGQRGEIHVVNINGETDTETLRAENPEIASRIERLWAY